MALKIEAQHPSSLSTVRRRKAIAMWRVSSREQREGFSIDAQKRAGIKWANGHALEISHEREAVETAKDDGRTVYQYLLKYWSNHPEIDVFLVEKVDRLSRNKKEYFQVKDFVFANAGKEIHLFKSGRILHRDSPATEWLFTDIEEDFAAHYSLNLSQEVKKGLNEKAAQGIYPTTAPFSYLNDKASKNIVPDPQRKDVFVNMASLYAVGQHSLDYIVDRAYREGLRSRRGNRITRNSWWLYFQNPVYTGKFYWGGELHSGSYESLWTWETHLALQKALRRNGKPRGRKWGEKDAVAFRGLGVCSSPQCPNPGRLLTGDGPKKNNESFIYYHCTTHSKPSIRQDRLASLLGDSLKKLEFPPDILEFVRQELHTSHESDRIQHAQTITSHEIRYNRLQTYIDQTYTDHLDEKISKEDYVRRANKWKAEQAMIEGELTRLRQINDDYYKEGVRILELAQRLHGLYVTADFEEKRELLQIVLQNFSFDGVSVIPVWRKPFDALAKSTQTADWLGA